MNSTIEPTVWEGCYESSWKGVITNESFAHPAKMSRDLLERIIRHGFERGWWQKGSTIADCFGGVGTTGIIGAYSGLRVVCVELEPRFVELAKANFERHRSRWAGLGYESPKMIQGDSRQFERIVDGIVEAVITSPPYATIAAGAGGLNTKRSDAIGREALELEGRNEPKGIQEEGSEGILRAVRSQGQSRDTSSGPRSLQQRPEESSSAVRELPHEPAQTNSLEGEAGRSANSKKQRAGRLEAIVTSPPWENNCEGSRKASKFKSPAAALKSKRGHGASDAAVLAQAARDEQKVYGDSEGQIGKEKAENYWTAMAKVYSACHRAIRPGGEPVMDGNGIDFCDGC